MACTRPIQVKESWFVSVAVKLCDQGGRRRFFMLCCIEVKLFVIATGSNVRAEMSSLAVDVRG